MESWWVEGLMKIKSRSEKTLRRVVDCLVLV